MGRVARHAARGGLCATLLAVLLVPACTAPRIRKEMERGRAYALEARGAHPLVRDPAVTSLVSQMGLQLLRADPPPYRYRFYVVDDPTPTSFAGPGGHVFVHSGALLVLQDANQLAALLAHEIGHVALRHPDAAVAIQRQRREQRAKAEVRRRATRGPDDDAPREPWEDEAPSGPLGPRYTPELEEEADAYAVELLRKAGFCPQALIPVAAALGEASPDETSWGTHLASNTRADALRERGVRPPCETSHPELDRRLFEAQARLLAPPAGGAPAAAGGLPSAD